MTFLWASKYAILYCWRNVNFFFYIWNKFTSKIHFSKNEITKPNQLCSKNRLDSFQSTTYHSERSTKLYKIIAKLGSDHKHTFVDESLEHYCSLRAVKILFLMLSHKSFILVSIGTNSLDWIAEWPFFEVWIQGSIVFEFRNHQLNRSNRFHV